MTQTQSIFSALKNEGLKSYTLNYDWQNATTVATVTVGEDCELKVRPDGSKYLQFTEDGQVISVNLKANTPLKEVMNVVKVTAIADITNDAGETRVQKGETRIFAV